MLTFKMFISQPILQKISVNYRDKNILPYKLRYSGMPPSRYVTKDPENPKTEYHTWLNANSVSYDRAKIIEQYNNNKKTLKKI